jgi:formate dehydrogenase beta subunit
VSEAKREPATECAPEVCATCTAACPVHTDTRAYTDLLAHGRLDEAFEKIREFNPFPSTCGLICHHPCEQACRRGTVDDPVALRNLKRFAVERALAHRLATRRRAERTQSKTVGIVGAGPSGLTVAHDVARAGYRATVYEALGEAGGMLRYAIPKYRLPVEQLRLDIEDVTALGVEVETGVRVGVDVTLEELRRRHDALVIAVGLSQSRMPPLSGPPHPAVVGAIAFLREVAMGVAVKVPQTVLVIGGGNVAVDVARTAVRLGATSVKMLCLENDEEMPAWDWECEEALEEGIEFVHRVGPTRAVVEDGTLTGLEVRAVDRVFDEQKRFSPTYFDDRRRVIPGRLVIMSIGQQSDLSLVSGTPVKLDERGRLVFDGATAATSQEGVFACGEVVSGPGSAIEAVRSGHRAARAAMTYLATGAVAPLEEPELPKVRDLPEETKRKVRRAERVAMPALPADQRMRNFEQFETGYDERMALAEARRCLSCTAGALVDDKKCAACLTCLRVCPFGVPAVDDVAVMCSEMCQACGMCAVECPAMAISIKRFAPRDIAARVVGLMKAHGPIARVEFVCVQDAIEFTAIRERVEAVDGVAVATVPVECAARVDEVDMMKPFEFGASAVVVKRCAACRYAGADERLARRVLRTKALLDAAGVGGQKLSLV